SGGSTGVLRDEYLESEFEDVLAVIDWCVAQNWCDGAVGLSGFSWSAFTALRVSDRKPAAVKAMVLGGVSEDGWRTDVHYLGGVPYTAQVDWAGVMLMFNALPPDPLQFGEGWRAAWKERLAANTPWIEPWLTHMGHDAYWKDKAARLESELPLLLYAGLADKYATSVLRIAEQWRGPVRTIVGPWEHVLPNLAAREPRIGFLQEALRWWDRWLKGHETGAMDAASLRLWVGAPDTNGNTSDGHWRILGWPLKETQTMELRGAAEWRPLHGAPADAQLNADLYEDAPGPLAADVTDIVAESEAQDQDCDILAAPTVRCQVDGDAQQIIARLFDVAGDGTSIRMATGALALSGEGEREIELPLQACAWRLHKGHRVVLTLHSDGWPTFWTSPGTLRIRDVRLSLPVVPAITKDEARCAPPVTVPSAANEKLKWVDREAEAIVFPARESALVRKGTSAAQHQVSSGTDILITSRFEVLRDWAAKSYRIAFERPGFSIRIDTRLEVASNENAWQISWWLKASDDGVVVHDHSGNSVIPRVS
ncbi:MAG TPA: CocE/NonD family hydrolase, partial [Rhizomicrobium sp.]|nr:CocE/NonD family hydrolase [Rhizomicrobium sp.]